MSNEGDFIWGAEEISKVIGRSKRQTYHLLESALLPAKLVGGKWVASRSRLIAFLSETVSP